MSSSDATSAASQVAESTLAILRPLLVASTNLSGDATFPWTQTFTVTAGSTCLFRSYELSDIPGLVEQSRQALFSNVGSFNCRFTKVPKANLIWRIFICSKTDFIDRSNYDGASLLDFIRKYPTCVPKNTLEGDTTQSDIDFAVPFPLGIGNAIKLTLPPLHEPLVVIFIESTSGNGLKGTQVTFTFHGTVRVQGFDHFAGRVTRAIPESG